MTDRETIIDLLQDVQAKGFWSYGTDMYTGEEGGHVMTPDLIADYLMENGVTVRKWIPVGFGLPDKEGTYIVRTKTGAVTTARFYTAKTFPATHYRATEYHREAQWSSNRHVTHWMPLPEPPQEE